MLRNKFEAAQAEEQEVPSQEVPVITSDETHKKEEISPDLILDFINKHWNSQPEQ
jgi:hypothetical protein